MNKKRKYEHYWYNSEKMEIVFTELYQPKRYGKYFYTPAFEIFVNDTFLGKIRSGFVFLFFFWSLEIIIIKNDSRVQ